MAYTWNGAELTYSISNDITAEVINHELFTDDLKSLEPFSAVLQYTQTVGDVGKVIYNTAPSSGDKTTIQNKITNHAGTTTTANWQFWEVNSEVTTTNETWTEKMSRTANAVKEGIYKVSWYWELSLNLTGPINSIAEARFLIDTNVKGNDSSGGPDADLPKNGGGIDRLILAEGDTPIFSIEIRRNDVLSGNDTAAIRKMKISLELMPE